MDRPDDAALLAEAETWLGRFGGERDYRTSSRLVRELSAALRAALQREQEMKADRSDWRKGVALIASALGDKSDNLSCVRIAEIALQQRADLEAAERELSTLRARTEQEDGTRLDPPERISESDQRIDDRER